MVMKKYRLHCFSQSGNAYKVALFLSCAGLDWEPVFVDFFNGAARDKQWQDTLNPMGEVPVLEVDDRTMTQSGAILTYLSETTGQFGAPDDETRWEVLRWILFDNHKFTANMAVYRFMKCFYPKTPDEAVMSFLKSRMMAAYATFNEHMVRREFVVTDRPTIADLSMAGYVFYPPEETGLNLAEDFPAIAKWADRIKAQPGWKGPYELMPGDKLKPLR